MRSIEGSNRVRNGIVGILILVLVVGVGQSFTGVPMLFAQPKYFGQFTDSGGLNPGDKVRIAGTDVGTIESLDIEGDHVVMGFSLGGNQIGTESRMAIRTDTIRARRSSRSNRVATRRCGPAGCCRSDRAPRRTRSTTRSSMSPRPQVAGTSTRSNGH